MARMRRTVNRTTFENLLRHACDGTLNPERIQGGTDRDYISLISQLRRYFYGNLSDSEIDNLLAMPISPKIRLGGQVALYPAVSSSYSWKEMDKYTRTTVFRALQKRRKILEMQFQGTDLPTMWYEPYSAFDRGFVTSSKGERVSLTLPSSVKMYKLVKRTVSENGPTRLRSTKGLYQL